MENNTLIAGEHLSFSFNDEAGHTHAVGPLSIEAKHGEFLGIVGPSGCGKSTLLRLLGGMVSPTKGSVTRSYERLGMVFQNYALFPWLSVFENASFGLKMQGRPKAEQREKALSKLHEIGLSGMERRYPHELSGGERQRVGIARALAINPDLLLLDEPFSNLDSITATSLKRDLVSIWERYRMTIIMVNHVVPDALELCDRVVVLSRRPAQILLEKRITLARPRNLRSEEFFVLHDEITKTLTSHS